MFPLFVRESGSIVLIYYRTTIISDDTILLDDTELSDGRLKS